MKEDPLPEGKPAEPLQQGKKKEKGRPDSSAAGRRKIGTGYVGIGSSSSCSTLPSPSPTTSSHQPLRQGTPATPREKGSLGGGRKPLEQGQKKRGLEVLPVTTYHEKHWWYTSGKPFDSFPEAVDHLLMMEG